jgi:hypothetical protein
LIHKFSLRLQSERAKKQKPDLDGTIAVDEDIVAFDVSVDAAAAVQVPADKDYNRNNTRKKECKNEEGRGGGGEVGEGVYCRPWQTSLHTYAISGSGIWNLVMSDVRLPLSMCSMRIHLKSKGCFRGWEWRGEWR